MVYLREGVRDVVSTLRNFSRAAYRSPSTSRERGDRSGSIRGSKAVPSAEEPSVPAGNPRILDVNLRGCDLEPQAEFSQQEWIAETVDADHFGQ